MGSEILGARKVIWSIACHVLKYTVSLLLIGFVTTCLVRLAPGFGTDERELDPRFAGTFSVHEPAPNPMVTYFQVLRDAVRGDFGFSDSLNRPVRELLIQRYSVSLEIISLGLAAGWLAAVSLAFAGAVLSTRAPSFTGRILGGFVLCIPSALLAYLCYLARAPAFLIVALVVFSRLFRVIDNLFQAARKAPYVVASKAHGLSDFRIFQWHILSSTGFELIALAGASVAIAVGATIPAEALCDQPGIGQLAWKAALARDLPLLVPITFLIGSITIFFNRSADAIVRFRRAA
jgi:peptide/nickel transport system permease protein